MTVCARCGAIEKNADHRPECPWREPTPRLLDTRVADLIGEFAKWALRIVYPVASVSAVSLYLREPLGRWSLAWLVAALAWAYLAYDVWRRR